jgi:hypothetical protein
MMNLARERLFKWGEEVGIHRETRIGRVRYSIQVQVFDSPDGPVFKPAKWLRISCSTMDDRHQNLPNADPSPPSAANGPTGRSFKVGIGAGRRFKADTPSCAE